MIRAACIGTGGISGVHLSYLKSRKDVEIVALCDINPENLEKRRGEFGGRGYADFREMLERERIDAMWVCTPPQVRGEPLRACADRGIPVLCEKPVERCPQTARQNACDLTERNARVQIGYLFRSLPIVQTLREQMSDDQVTLVESFYGCNMGITRAARAWFYDKELSGGPLVDQATHNFDLLRMLFGEVASVRGTAANPVHRKEQGYTIDEVISLSFLFENGMVGGHVHTWVGDAWRNEIVLSGRQRLYRLNLNRNLLRVEEDGKSTEFVKEAASPYLHENARFLEMVVSGDWSANPCDYADGVKTLELTLASDAAVSTVQKAESAVGI